MTTTSTHAAPAGPPTASPATREEFLTKVQSERALKHLSRLQRDDAYDWDRLFPKTEGMGAAGDIKRRVRMLESVEPRLDFLLYPGERIEFITKGTLNSFVEQWFLGIWSLVINRTLMLFTNYRIILINSDGKHRAKAMMWQIPYDRLKKFGAGSAVTSTTFKIEKGRTYKFVRVPRSDRKRLKQYVRERVEEIRQQEFKFPSHVGRDPLCTTCATPVPPRTHQCPECGERFIPPIQPALMSLIVPGTGDLYLGHRGIAMVELFGFLALLLLTVAVAVDGGLAAAIVPLAVLVVANMIDSIVTLHIASKGVLAERLAWRGREKRRRGARESSAGGARAVISSPS